MVDTLGFRRRQWGGRVRTRTARAALDNLAFVATKIQRHDVLPALYKALLPFADTFGHSAVAHPCGHHYLALLAACMGKPERAQDHFAAASAMHDRAGAPLLLAESLLDWDEFLTITGAPRPEMDGIRSRAAEALAGRTAAFLSDRLSRARGRHAR